MRAILLLRACGLLLRVLAFALALAVGTLQAREPVRQAETDSPIAAGVDWEERQVFRGRDARAGEQDTLRILSSTDTVIFEPLIKQFLALYPELSIEYLVAGSTTLYEAFLAESHAYDLVISSAMDLQLKLVNDGHAWPVDDIEHPPWAHWRQSLFGFTLEPASFIVNRQAFADLPLPRTRHAMIQVLRANAERFRGRVGTYDVRESGLGYLFATQDARSSETYWRLMEIMGSLGTKLYCCSSQMISDIVSGELAVGYNVLSSYAEVLPGLSDDIEIIYPADFPITMMRTAFVSRDSARLPAAVSLLRFLAASRWTTADETGLMLPGLPEDPDRSGKSVIELEPGLLVHLDGMKRKAFIRAWENAIIQ